jgi:hypothetical protein
MISCNNKTRHSVFKMMTGITTIAALSLLLVISVPLASLAAQRQAQPSGQRANPDTTPLPKALATITTDTGDFAPGHHDFTRYTDLRWCLVAATDTRYILRRTLKAQDNLDLVHGTPERDTLPSGVILVARNCIAHFTVAGTAIKDLPLLFDLALMAGKDSIAHSVLARLVNAAPTVEDKRQVLMNYIGHYLKAEPARVGTVDSLVAQKDKLGQPGLPQRVPTYTYKDLTSTDVPRLHQTAPPVRADFWFPAPGRDTIQPAPGIVSVILKPYLGDCLRRQGYCGGEYFERVRRLVERYRSDGMSITMVINAPGYKVIGNPASADSVAQSYRWFLQDYLKWQVNVAVRSEAVMFKLPAPDGRIFYGRTKYRDLYDSSSVVMTDRTGKVIYSVEAAGSGLNLDINLAYNIPRFEVYVEHAMAASKQAIPSVPGSAPSSPSPSSNK